MFEVLAQFDRPGDSRRGAPSTLAYSDVRALIEAACQAALALVAEGPAKTAGIAVGSVEGVERLQPHIFEARQHLVRGA